jgi:PAS domain S-box-containing protein
MPPIEQEQTALSGQGAPVQTTRAQFASPEYAARIGYWRHDLVSNQVTWSPGIYRILELDPTDPNANTNWIRDQIQPDDLRGMNEAIRTAIKTRSSFTFRVRAKDPDANVKIVETHGDVECSEDGRVVAILGVSHDITQQVAAEDARRHAEKMYRAMAEHASDIILLFNNEDRTLYASEALERILGRQPSEIDQHRFLELVHPDDLAEAEKLGVPPMPGQTLTATYRVRHKDGHYVWIEATSRSVHDQNGRLQNVITVSRDITDRIEREIEIAAARDRAEAANLAKSTFLANMSHELRTPLNAIIGFADIMQQQMFGPLGGRRYEEYATLIHESGELLLDLVSDVLDMAKIEAGKLELHPQPVDLRSIVSSVVRILADKARAGEVSLTEELDDGDLSLEADRRAVKQILLNLVSNAVKFTLSGGHVVVRVTRDAENLRIAVADNGIGIPAEALPRLGKPFEQVSTDPAVAKGGTGLGLALVRALTDKHGGAMRIESEEGIGTAVTVELPISQDARAAA